MQEVRAVPGFSSWRKINIFSIDLEIEPILNAAYAVSKSQKAWSLIAMEPLCMLDLDREPMITIN